MRNKKDFDFVFSSMSKDCEKGYTRFLSKEKKFSLNEANLSVLEELENVEDTNQIHIPSSLKKVILSYQKK